MSEQKDQTHRPDHAPDEESGQVSETGFNGDAPDLDADAVPVQRSTPGPDTPEL